MGIAAQAIDIAEYEDKEPTPGVLVSMDGQHCWTDSENGAYEIGDILSLRSPFAKKGEALQISSKHMDIGVPYPFQFMEWWFVAIKRLDGDLYFYYLG